GTPGGAVAAMRSRAALVSAGLLGPCVRDRGFQQPAAAEADAGLDDQPVVIALAVLGAGWTAGRCDEPVASGCRPGWERDAHSHSPGRLSARTIATTQTTIRIMRALL
ncbi:MAG: hypothetical protein ACRDLV_05105, partial [Solirubrobacteraceae bacterium]